jgi:LuxR family transcriptional regulator, quorum-sensing system regulator SdiA
VHYLNMTQVRNAVSAQAPLPATTIIPRQMVTGATAKPALFKAKGDFDASRDLQQWLQDQARALGARHVSFVMRHVPGITGDDPLVIETYGPAWREHSLQEKFDQVDPARTVADRAMEPIDWAELPRTRPRLRKFFRHFMENDLGRNAVSSVFRGPLGDRSVLTLTSDSTERRWLTQKPDLMSGLLLLHPSFHRTVLRSVFRIEGGEIIKLTPRERECLGLAAHGLTSKQIGENLGLTAATVNFFIDAAAVKLGAGNRAHATAKAVALGLIPPPR